ncbi:MAG: ABC transporter ATP-binding protein [Ruminiclostridium sp.]|nr:ABC transporter ATP-binding protein [Ruminiclostridium sp.]
MLEIRGLKKSYKDFKVLDGLDMKINRGDIYGFLGKNGCGKTTTMNIVCNVIPKDEGELILGENGGEKIKIGYLPESPSLYGYMNGYEYLGYIAYCSHFDGDVNARISAVLSLTGMTEGAKRRIKGYSRGMNQRLGIAAAIFNKPELLILDEPTSALDPEGRAEVMHIISALSEAGTTILLCTHILSDVERVANRVGILTGGRLAVEGSIEEILSSYGTDSVEIQFSEPDMQAVGALNESGLFKKVDFYDKTLTAVCETDEASAGIRDAMRVLADNKAKVSGVKLSRPTLEQVYLNIVGSTWK